MQDNTLILHPAQARPIARHPCSINPLPAALVPSISVMALCDPAPANGDEALITLWLDGRPPRPNAVTGVLTAITEDLRQLTDIEQRRHVLA